jgi:hypothetical protein
MKPVRLAPCGTFLLHEHCRTGSILGLDVLVGHNPDKELKPRTLQTISVVIPEGIP